MNKKLLSAITLTIAVSLFNTGCKYKTYDSGCIESGNRSTLLLGLIDYQKDYSIDSEAEGFIFEEKPIESDTYAALRTMTTYSTDHNYELEGKKLSLLWGLIRFKY